MDNTPTTRRPTQPPPKRPPMNTPHTDTEYPTNRETLVDGHIRVNQIEARALLDLIDADTGGKHDRLQYVAAGLRLVAKGIDPTQPYPGTINTTTNR